MCQVVEHYNSFSRRRVDLFGFIDILCLKDDKLLGIQTTSTGNINARVKKILANPIHRMWLDAGLLLEVQGWAKRGKRGKVKRWTVKRIQL